MEEKLPIYLIMITSWVLSAGLHEAGHAFTADRLGDPTPGLAGRLTLNPFAHLKPIATAIILPLVLLLYSGMILGGATTPINPSFFRKPLRDRLVVALAGPAVNVVLALLFTGIHFVLPASLSFPNSLYGVLVFQMVYLNLILIAINLLPIPGLDGGDVLRFFLSPALREKFDELRQFGLVIMLVFLSIPAISRYYFKPVALYLDLVFGRLGA